MQRQSPPKHRHDGTSPLPLGMDWSPPPRKWNGRDTVWPHDPHTGWSYCITIPSWVVLPKSKDSDPVVFYRVQVGIQSPEGVTTMRGVLRRFNDFLKLYAALKKAFPKKNLPSAPPKGLLRLKSRTLLEERRCSLEEWMGNLLSDIDISRSIIVASFLELESAARSSFQDENQPNLQAKLSVNTTVSLLPPGSSQLVTAGSTPATPDYGSDTAYETSEVGTSSHGRDNISEVGTEDLSVDEDLTSPIEKLVKYGVSNIDEGLFMGHAILEQLEGFPSHTVHAREINKVIEQSMNNGNGSSAAYFSGDARDVFSEPDHGKMAGDVGRFSNGSVGSEISSLGRSGLSNLMFSGTFTDGPIDVPRGAEVSKPMGSVGSMEFQDTNDVNLVLPLDQQQKMNRILVNMQRRLGTAKTDMEDLISRLNQEIAVKDYLTTKVKDLEEELESTKRKSKENLQQAILIEREGFTQMQWDMEELKRKSLEMEFKLKAQQDEKPEDPPKESMVQQNNILLEELETTKKKLDDLLKKHQELEVKSKAEAKVLIREVKSLRSSQAELKQQLSQSLMGKSEAEKQLHLEKQSHKREQVARKKLLHECEILHNQLRECSSNLLDGHKDKLVLDNSSRQEALDLLTISDNRIELLLAEVQILVQEDNQDVSAPDKTDGRNDDDDDDRDTMDMELRKMLSEILVDNIALRKQLSSVIHYTLGMGISSETDDLQAHSEKPVRHKSLDLR